jgi:hypothetical protein
MPLEMKNVLQQLLLMKYQHQRRKKPIEDNYVRETAPTQEL